MCRSWKKEVENTFPTLDPAIFVDPVRRRVGGGVRDFVGVGGGVREFVGGDALELGPGGSLLPRRPDVVPDPPLVNASAPAPAAPASVMSGECDDSGYQWGLDGVSLDFLHANMVVTRWSHSCFTQH